MQWLVAESDQRPDSHDHIALCSQPSRQDQGSGTCSSALALAESSIRIRELVVLHDTAGLVSTLLMSHFSLRSFVVPAKGQPNISSIAQIQVQPQDMQS